MDAEKRKAEEPAGAPTERKRQRWDSAAPAAAPAAPAAPAAAGGDAVSKAKAVLQKSSELQEKLAKLRQLKEMKEKGTPVVPVMPTVVPETLARMMDPTALAKVQAIANRLSAAKGGLMMPPASLAVAPPVAAAGSAAAKPGFRPPVLRLDAQGREVDEQGNVVKREVVQVSTLKVNARAGKANALEEAMAAVRRETQEGQTDSFFDDRMGAAGRKREKRAGLAFVEEGKFQKQAEMMRLKAKFGPAAMKQLRVQQKREAAMIAREQAAEAAAAAEAAEMDPNQVPLGTRPGRPPPAPIPDVEWWDLAILPDGATYEAVAAGNAQPRKDKMTVYVEHPIPRAPPAEPPPPPPQPLKLTKKEQKKLRTQRRVAREKEKQEMIRQGLLEPPKPKVKISNLMRVLTAEATADPTAVEKEVRKQMAERSEAHADRNLARKLLPAEKTEKKLRKLFADSTGAVETVCCVYRVERMDNRQNMYKVTVNAEENRLTGVCVISDAFAVLVIEGVRKSVTRYNKLMMRRIDWSLKAQKLTLEDAAEDEDDDEAVENKCTLVWQGTVLKPAFRRWMKFETVRTEATGSKYFEDLGLKQYWDAAAAGTGVDDTLI